jgi:hypothetical protein
MSPLASILRLISVSALLGIFLWNIKEFILILLWDKQFQVYGLEKVGDCW